MKSDIRSAFDKQRRRDWSFFSSGQRNCIPQDSKNAGYSPLPVRNLEAILLLLAVVGLCLVLCQDPLLSHHVHSCKQNEMGNGRTQTLLSCKQGKYIPSETLLKSTPCLEQQISFTFLSLFSLFPLLFNLILFFQQRGSLLHYDGQLGKRTSSKGCFFNTYIISSLPSHIYQPCFIVVGILTHQLSNFPYQIP